MPEITPKPGICTADILRIRKGPAVSFTEFGQLARGDRFDVIGKEGAWHRIRRNSIEGFVHGDYVRLVDPAPTPGYPRTAPATAPAAIAAPVAPALVLTPAGANLERTALPGTCARRTTRAPRISPRGPSLYLRKQMTGGCALFTGWCELAHPRVRRRVPQNDAPSAPTAPEPRPPWPGPGGNRRGRSAPRP
jgi:hypothetical protein